MFFFQSNNTKVLGILLFLFSFMGNAQNGWHQKASHGGDARHRSTAFAIGNKGYFGGGHINSGVEVTYSDYWQFDPSTNSWSQIADFGGGKRYHSTAFTIGNWAYVGCGEDGADTYHNDLWKYSPIVNTWFPCTALPGNPRRGAVAFVIGDYAYFGTGQSDFGYEVDFYKFDPVSETWTTIADFIGQARSGAVAFSHQGLGYLGTGHILGDATKDFYSYDPITDTWEQKANVGTFLRQDATGFVLNGKGYIVTGNNDSGDSTYNDVWEYNFDTDEWKELEEFPGTRRRYMVSFVIDNIAYAGSGTSGTNLRDFWAFQPFLNKSLENRPEIKLGPNPSSDLMDISIPNESVELKIFDLDGKLVYTRSFNEHTQIRKSEIGTGKFILTLITRNQRINQRIIFV